jgi:FtsP/CotA-like multicopper oxidase with cupredoxin domain
MRLRLRVVPLNETDPAAGKTLPFYIVGSDQSLRRKAARRRNVDFIPGERLDLVIDFSEVDFESRVIIENRLGDAPFGGEFPVDDDDLFANRRTDRIMAFDVVLNTDKSIRDSKIDDDCDMIRESTAVAIAAGDAVFGDIGVQGTVTRTRKLALFEGTDEFGRLQPLLGTAEQTDINWPVLAEPIQTDGLLVGKDDAGDDKYLPVPTGPMEGSIPWHLPITENPELGATEIWEIYNTTGDAHPMHVHLVHFKVLDRQECDIDVEEQAIIQHNSATTGRGGVGFRITGIHLIPDTVSKPKPSERTRRDMVMALPGQVTRIKMHFDKPGRYVWHCHILSHEDHEMMRPFHVGPIAADGQRPYRKDD